MKGRWRAALLVILLAMAGYVVLRLTRGSGAPQPGTILLSVGGRYRTTVTLPATATWCPVTRMAQLEAVSVDTGFSVALRENEAVTTGQHPVFAPEMLQQAPKPSATAAMRWLRMSDTTVVAYRAVSGHVDLDEAGALVSGSVTLRLFNGVGNDSLPVQGRFAGVKLVAMAAGCT
jgi:hypothetical protein